MATATTAKPNTATTFLNSPFILDSKGNKHYLPRGNNSKNLSIEPSNLENEMNKHFKTGDEVTVTFTFRNGTDAPKEAEAISFG